MRTIRILAAVLCFVVPVLGNPSVSLSAGTVQVTLHTVTADRFPGDLDMLVTVADSATGIPVKGLTAADFKVVEDGKAYPINQATSAISAQVPVAVALVLDTSGSMAGQPLTDAASAASAFITSLGDKDACSVVAFSKGKTITPQALGADRNACKNALNGLTAEGNTPLYDAAYEATQALSLFPPGRKVVVLLSDGEDTNSLVTAGNVIDLANRSGVTFYAVGLRSADLKPDVLSRLAGLTGGTFLEAPGSADLTKLYERIADLLKQQYTIKYAPRSAGDGKEHTVAVTVQYQGSEARSGERTFTTPRAFVGGVEFANFADGQVVTKTVGIAPMADRVRGGIAKAEYWVDGIAMPTSPPTFTLTLDPSVLPAGNHVLKIRAVDPVGNEATRDVAFVVTPADQGPSTGLLIFGGALLLIVAAAGFLLYSRRSRQQSQGATRSAGLAGQTAAAPDVAADDAYAYQDATAAQTSSAQAGSHTVPLRPDRGLVGSLILKNGPRTGHAFRVDMGEATIGRAGSNTIVLDDTTVSRQHAKVTFQSGGFFIHDLASANHTFVNGRQVTKQRLEDGDEIRFGETKTLFQQTRT